MKIIAFIFSAAFTIFLVYVLNIQLPVKGGKTPILGYFLSPQKGFWQNAEPVNTVFNASVVSNQLQSNSEVDLDDRLVPHVYAGTAHDAYFIEGYLHAKFRLWEMEFITDAAAGRLSEIMGDSSNGKNFLRSDEYFRRLGMTAAAETALKALGQDTAAKASCDAYTDGVNAYIKTLDETTYPLEYKLLDYKPEPWTDLRTLYLLKYLAFDLAGYEQDFEMTNAKNIFTKTQFEALYPYGHDSSEPIIPKGTPFPKRGPSLTPPAIADSVYFNFKLPATDTLRPRDDNGSNNWAVAGSRTASGRPILCNDPHLDLSLPAIWYEIHLSAPGLNVYGVSIPGSPGVVIGFNDSCAWGMTNSERDVKDYYEITFQDSTEQQYLYNGSWHSTTFRDEIIKIKGKPADTLHIPETVWGPVMYNAGFPDKLHSNKAYAVHWAAAEDGHEIKALYDLNRINNFQEYESAIAGFKCPAQNFAFASKSGDIAIKEPGNLPARWRGQGDFVMPGSDSTFAWRGYIPDSLNIMLHNPAQGFVSSANQMPYDTSYPYYLSGKFDVFRSIIINRFLSGMQHATVDDMQKMQNSNYNVFAEMARPVLLGLLKDSLLNKDATTYLNIIKTWNLENNATEKAPTIFELWWQTLQDTVYGDEFAQTKLPLPLPTKSTLLDAIIKDSVRLFADNISTAAKETIADDITDAFLEIVPYIKRLDDADRLVWGKFKNSRITHLLQIPALSRLSLFAGGGEGVINAYSGSHGPSWKMIAELTDKTNARGIYPGGQTGNPGSKYYDSFINDYIDGKYYELLFLDKAALQKQTVLKGILLFAKA